MPRHLGPGGGPSCLGIWVPPDPKWGGTHMPVTPALMFTAHTYYLESYLITHHMYELNSARTGFIQVYKTRTSFGNPDHFWQPKVVRGRTNFGSQKWSARTTFCPDQFSRDKPSCDMFMPCEWNWLLDTCSCSCTATASRGFDCLILMPAQDRTVSAVVTELNNIASVLDAGIRI